MQTRKALRPTDAAISHWETPEAAINLGMGDSQRKGEKQQNMDAGGSRLVDAGKKLPN